MKYAESLRHSSNEAKLLNFFPCVMKCALVPIDPIS